MKKTIIIIILAVYIASIAIVNFFGLEIKVFDGITRVDSIQCDTVTVYNEIPIELESAYDLDGIPVFEFEFIPAPSGKEYTKEDQNPNAVQINYELLPHIEPRPAVNFIFDENAMEGYAFYHEMSRTFVFLKPGQLFTITIRAMDGSNVSTKILIRGVLPSEQE